jgi:hypothetical protein
MTDEDDDDDDDDTADPMLQRGQVLRELRAMEQQDEVERAHSLSSDTDATLAPVTTTLPNGETILCYESFLAHQLCYDDLKHVDHKFIDYGDFKTETRLVIEQDKSLGKGGLCWDAAFILGEHIVQTIKDTPLPIRAIELGCGTGLCGLIVGKAVSNAHIVLTDLPELLLLLTRNVARNFNERTNEKSLEVAGASERVIQNNPNNGFRGSVMASVLCWGNLEQEAQHGKFDIVFGADVVSTLYDPIALAETISNLSHSQSIVYVSFKERLSSIHRQFEESMHERFGTIEILQPRTSRNLNPEVHILVARHRKPRRPLGL